MNSKEFNSKDTDVTSFLWTDKPVTIHESNGNTWRVQVLIPEFQKIISRCTKNFVSIKMKICDIRKWVSQSRQTWKIKYWKMSNALIQRWLQKKTGRTLTKVLFYLRREKKRGFSLGRRKWNKNTNYTNIFGNFNCHVYKYPHIFNIKLTVCWSEH